MAKTRLGEKILSVFTRHPWLKIFSLVLAILIWIYVQGEINRYNY